MPQRFLKPGITNSEKWNTCGWMAQSFYIRLLTLVDDFGRYESHLSMLRGHAFAMRDDVKAEKMEELCRELSDKDLVIFFECNGKQFLQITNWREKPRADESRFPTFDNTCKQMFTDDSKCTLPSFIVPRSSPPLLGKVVVLPEEVLLWNSFDQLPEVKSISAKRVQKLKERRKDPFWSQNLKAALGRISKSEFCLGKNDRGWKADFDWILQPDVVLKVMEGKYDNRMAEPVKAFEDSNLLTGWGS